MDEIKEGYVDLTNPNVNVRANFGGPVNRFSPEEGITYRIRLTSGQVVMRRRHYSHVDKRYYRCLDYQGYCPACVAASNKVKIKGKQISRATESYAANILVYDIDENTGQLKQPLNAEVYFWIFGADKFVSLRNIINEWGPIEELDLQVVCTDSQFQKLTFTPARKCLYLESGPEFKAACDSKIEKDSYPLEKFICKEITVAQMVGKFGLDESYLPPSSEDPSPVDTANTGSTAQSLPDNNFADLSSIQDYL